MSQLLEYIVNQLEEIKNKNLVDENEKQQIEEYISKLNSIKSNPSSLEESLFEEILTSDQLQTKEFKSLRRFKVLFDDEEMKKESQVKKSLEYLDRIIKAKLEEFETRKTDITGRINSRSESIPKYNELKELLNEYNENRYIKEEELLLLDFITDDLEPTEELIKLYIKIGKNNARIENERHVVIEEPIQEEVPVEEQEDELLESAVESIQDRQNREEINHILEKKKEILQKYAKFINNEEYKNLDEKLYNSVLSKMNNFENVLKDCNDDIFEFSLAVETDIEFISLFDQENSFLIGFCIAILNAYEENNIEKVKEIVSLYYRNDIILDLKKSLSLQGYKEYSDMIKIIEEKYDTHEFRHSREYNILYSTTEQPKNLEQNLKALDISLESYYKYQVLKSYDDIIYSIQDKSRDDINEKNDELKEKLQKLKEKYDVLKSYEEPHEEINENSPYLNSFENYIVFFDPEGFMESYTETIEQHSREVRAKTYIDNLNRIIQTQYLTLSKDLHRIKTDKSPDPRLYELGDNSVRIGIKKLDGANVKGHNVYIIFSSGYGRVDGKPKNEILQRSVQMHTKEGEEQLKEIFAESKNKEEITQEAQALINASEKIYLEIYDQIPEYTPGVPKGGK